ncbi:MAG: MBL fold metallo-hydrolase [Promethearchaeota archaeon]
MSLDISRGIPEGNLKIKVLATNETSSTLLTDEKFHGKVVQPESGAAGLLAEHGLALGIQVEDAGGAAHNFLLDAGGLKDTVLDNAMSLGFKIGEVEKFVLSHGHVDHWGGLRSVLQELPGGCEVVLNPLCYEQQHIAVPRSGEVIPPDEFAANYRALKRAGTFSFDLKLPKLSPSLVHSIADERGLKVVETGEPILLCDGATTSGEIPLSDPGEVTPGFYVLKGRKQADAGTFRDETSLYFNVEGKGLVVVTGCGHCGILNTIKHGQALTGIERVYAVIGGFHEEWNAPRVVDEKVEALEELGAEVVCGMHCTGFYFNRQMYGHPAHALGVVGTEFRL